MVAEKNVSTKDINVKKLQRRLRAIGGFLSDTATKATLLTAILGHILPQGRLIGKYKRQ